MNSLFFNQEKKLLCTLWVFVTLNYLYCDLIGLMDSNLLNQYLTGEIEGLKLTPDFLLGAAILMELPIAMVLLSNILIPKYNWWTNIIVASIKTIAMIATLFVGTPTSYYLFFAIIEISTTLFIIGYCINWMKKLD